jgi:hypothetical protein
MAQLDPMTLAQMDKSKVLAIVYCGREATCAISGCPRSQYDDVVKLPGGRVACPDCAADWGWTVR